MTFCCGWSLWCILDRLTLCRIKAVCDRHEDAFTGSAA